MFEYHGKLVLGTTNWLSATVVPTFIQKPIASHRPVILTACDRRVYV